MSWRTLIEINHDRLPTPDYCRSWAMAIRHVLVGGEKKHLPTGVTFLQTRHHSEPEPNGWVPPANRKPGYRCLGVVQGEWRCVVWEDAGPGRYTGLWRVEGENKVFAKLNQPKSFWSLPAPLGETPT